VNAGSAALKREVTVGSTVDGVSEILSGIKAGERVAVQGVASLSDGVKVKDIAAANASSGGGAQ